MIEHPKEKGSFLICRGEFVSHPETCPPQLYEMQKNHFPQGNVPIEPSLLGEGVTRPRGG